ncbi:MAG: TonB-dependent receptor [Bacteroidales bacterium]|nr:TonB-dependent receptor [Bacteroidales bacterium]
MKPTLRVIIACAILWIASGHSVHAQKVVQTIKGTVTDKESRTALPGATVYLDNASPVKGTLTDENGNFRLENVETGRIRLCIRYLGYESICLENLNLTSGKELVLNIGMEEALTKIDEVVVKANERKSATVNTMSSISTRTFSVEETQRYAGVRNDVARMAINYAGVSAGNDATNEIIIRGNAPGGLLWQLEGVEISNPNHFGFMGATGGPVGMLNNNTLSNSDFLTGAFAAEYGNAVSGVFDLRMREGNHDKHEFLGQVGFNGFELGAEGPVSKKGNASYLINYRYSTLGLFHLLGINFGTGTAIPEYQDVSFKITSRLGKGKVSLFGLGGISAIDLLYSKTDSADQENFYESEGFDIYNSNRQGVVGLNYFRRLGDKTYAELTLSADALQNKSRIDTVLSETESKRLFELTDFNTQNYAANLSISSKFSSRLNTRVGLEMRSMNFSLKDSVYLSKYGSFFNIYDDKGSTTLTRAYAEFNLKLADIVSLSGGVHAIGLSLNGEFNVEPRVAIKYKPFAKHSLSLGYGNHSKILPMFVYYRRIDLNAQDYVQPNKDLGMLKANHFVATWDWQINAFTRIKMEGYYQHLYNVAIEEKPGNFSMLNNNSFQFIIPDTMVNGGTGNNKGFEFTVERFLNKGFYYLLTASVFDSRYKGSDGIERSTAFDGGYVFNSLAGKEFRLKGKNESKKSYISADIKLTAAGGQRYTPVDIQESVVKGETVYDDDRAYREKFKDYFRFDIKIAWRMDNPKFSQEFAFDIQNVTNRKNPLYMQYNKKTGKTEFINQLTIFPVVQYRIMF